MNRLAILLFILTCSACSAAPNYRNVSTITQSDKPVIASLADELRQEHEAGTFDGVILVTFSASIKENGITRAAHTYEAGDRDPGDTKIIE